MIVSILDQIVLVKSGNAHTCSGILTCVALYQKCSSVLSVNIKYKMYTIKCQKNNTFLLVLHIFFKMQLN